MLHTSSAGPPVRRSRTSAVAWFAVVAMTLVALIAPARAAAAPPAPSAEGEAALDWLEAQLAAHGDTVPSPYGPGIDWGVTQDVVLGLIAAGRGEHLQTRATLAQVTRPENIAAFTTYRVGSEEIREAGPTAKTVLVLLSSGHSTTVDGADLVETLRSLMLDDGPERGRFVDEVPDPSWNGANGISQSMAISALSSTPEGVPPEAIEFLLARQCDSGGFPLLYPQGPCLEDSSTEDSGTDDSGGTTADPDTTALTVSALLGVRRTAEVDASLQRAVEWLLERQHPDGSFGGQAPWTSEPNTNSTGLIAQALRASGRTEAADRAADWIVANQIDEGNAAGTPAGDHRGAIGYDPAVLATALTHGIPPQVSDQWRRSTSQAVLGLGLSTYGVRDAPPLGSPSSSTTTTTTTGSPTPGAPTPGSPTPGSATTEPTIPGTSPTTLAVTTTPAEDVDPVVEFSGEVGVPSGSPTRRSASATETRSPSDRAQRPASTSRGGSLPRTGTHTAPLLVGAVVLIAAGGILVGRPRPMTHGTEPRR